MSPAAVKGIIVSLSIIAALSVAVLENPQVQEWLEEQRKKIAELLRSIGEDLDPASRRAAEAFAYEGRTPANDESLRREASGSRDAAALATGRSPSLSGVATALNSGSVRRIPVQGPTNPDEAEERRRKGREYLAKQNQQMFELRQRRKTPAETEPTTPLTPQSFDDIVDRDGKLLGGDREAVLPSPPIDLPVAAKNQTEMAEIAPKLAQPVLIGESSSSTSAWQLGSQLANPFGDEYALDRSETPKPPVPPKIELDDDSRVSEEDILENTPAMPGSFDDRPLASNANPLISEYDDDPEYQEQLAIALSLSEAEKHAKDHLARQQSIHLEDMELHAAIQASLRDMERAHAEKTPNRWVQHQQHQQPRQPSAELLVDLSPAQPSLNIAEPVTRNHWERVFDPDYHPSGEPLSLAPSESDHDELYRITPQLTSARLASLDTSQSLPRPSAPLPFDPVREAADRLMRTSAHQTLPVFGDASFYSARSSGSPSPPRTHAPESEPERSLIDLDTEPPHRERTPTPTSRGTTLGFQTDSDSETDTFASVPAIASRTISRAESEISNVEVLDVVDDSDVDMLSEEGDGIPTPDSWTEVGSEDGDSEPDDQPSHVLQQLRRAS